MTLSDFDMLPASPRFDVAVERLSRLQAGLMSEALKRATDDAGAAMARQLSDPLTALLLYLHGIKRVMTRLDCTEAAATSLGEMADMALRETERACMIIGDGIPIVDAAASTEAVIMQGFAAIEAWTHNGQIRTDDLASVPHERARINPLTPREHEVLALIVDGFSNKEGGYRLGISTRTFEVHRARVMSKTGARNAADLIRKTLKPDQ